jgi:asparagine synthetase B (glutamine-hydrolysing)
MQTTSDTEVIVRLYERFGASCVRLLDGIVHIRDP